MVFPPFATRDQVDLELTSQLLNGMLDFMECIQEVLGQTYSNIEVSGLAVVIDQGSSELEVSNGNFNADS